jgi:shikimate dehydrogenase
VRTNWFQTEHLQQRQQRRLVRNRLGTWEAHNTDVLGFRALIESTDIEIEGETVVVLGAGGAAAATIYALNQMGAREVLVWNRGRKRAISLKKLFGGAIKIVETIEDLQSPGLIVNATSLGLAKGDTDRFEQSFGLGIRNLTNKSKNIACIDLVYTTKEEETTVFGAWAEAIGLKNLADGRTMLKAQAVAGVSHWFGIPLNPSDIIDAIEI